MSAVEVDALPVADFYSYVAGLELMVEENQRVLDRVRSRR